MADIFFGLTDIGKVRVNNEDTFIAQTAMNNKFIIACAIDGVGGYSGGEVAAALAKETILEYFSKSESDIISMMKEALLLVNERIHAEKQEVKQHESMACVLTLAVVDIGNNEFYYAHVGDTRLYLLRDNSLVKLTKDQSFVGFLEDTGRLTEDAAMSHPKRNEINKALGFGGLLEKGSDYFETGHSPFLPGDMLLLCSDGLTDMVNRQDITTILIKDNSLEEKARQLIDAANKNGGKDNITAVLVKNDKSPQKLQATMPAAIEKKKIINKEESETINKNEEEPLIIEPEAKPQKNTISLTILSLLCIGLLASSLYLLWELGKRPNASGETEIVTVQKSRNPQEIQIQAALNTLQGDTLILNDSVYSKPIIISDTLQIKADTLYILARGNIVLKSDSTYKGLALLILPHIKHLVLDGLVFEDFDVAISSQSRWLTLKGVRFINCRNPLQLSFSFPGDQYINGSITDAFFKTDSLTNPLTD